MNRHGGNDDGKDEFDDQRTRSTISKASRNGRHAFIGGDDTRGNDNYQHGGRDYKTSKNDQH